MFSERISRGNIDRQGTGGVSTQTVHHDRSPMSNLTQQAASQSLGKALLSGNACFSGSSPL